MTAIPRALFYGKRLLECHSLRQRIKKITYNGDKKGLIVFNTIGCAVADVDAEHYLAYLMAQEGYNVKILLDDFQMPHWEYIIKEDRGLDYTFHRSLKNRILRGAYAKLSDFIFKHPRIEVIHYSKILKAITEQPALSEKDKNHAESSVRKYFQSGAMDPNNPEHRNYYEESLRNVEISKRVAIYIDQKLKPNLYFTSHGFYSAWGPAKDYLEEKGYPTIVYNPICYREQHILLAGNTTYSLAKDKSWTRFKEKSLNKKQIMEVDNYFAKRFQGTAHDNKIYYGGFSKHHAIDVKKGDARVTLGLFPNIIWDGDVVERNTIYKGPVDWVIDTIDYVEKNPSLHLVLRFHPAEATYYKTSRKLESIIEERRPQLRKIKNITVISSDQKIKTYELINDHIDVALVYDGMVGFEAVHMGKPVILAAKGKMSGAGAAFEPSSREKYLEMLAGIEKSISDFKQGPYNENFYKYAYWLFYEQCFRLPIFSEEKYAYIQYRPDPEKLDPTYAPEIKRVINYFNDQISN